ncbi:MAG: outer membrane protein transport protein [Desulfobacterales bacterium]
MKKLLITVAALGLTVGFVATASASNGYFGHGYSIKEKGMAGAGVAAPMDAMGVANNPAGLTEVGNRFDLGLSIFSPKREYTVGGTPYGGGIALAPGTVESDKDYFFIPNMAYSAQINDNSAWGIAVYGNGGMNTDYPAVNGYGTFGVPGANTGVDLMQLFIAPTYAFKFAEKHSFGITPIIGVQFFEARGLSSFGDMGMSSNPDKLSNNGHDSAFGFGGRIGYLGQLTDQFSIGLAWQSKIYMDEFDDYAGLFAEQGDMDIPSNWTIGLAFMATPTVTLAFDVQQIYYSDVKSVNNSIYSPGFLGDDNGPGFGWDDMTIFKFGLQWARTEQWAYRFGYSYGEQPIPTSSLWPNENETTFNIIAPGVIEQHATFGLTYTFESKGELDFSFMYAFENDITGYQNFDPGQTVTLTMSQWELGIGYSWVF